MSVPRASRNPASDPVTRSADGVRVVAAAGIRKSVWLVASAFALAAIAVWVLFRFSGGARQADPAPEPPPAAQLEAPPTAPTREDAPAPSRTSHARRIPAAPQDAPVPNSNEPPEREDPAISFGPPGQKTGVALFPPMGTKPVKIGIVVPDDFEVPEGYVRHFQATEDGELLPAILLFHPDYEWVDDAGNLIALPVDRVVPPEMAPPGLSIQMLTLPPAKDGAR